MEGQFFITIALRISGKVGKKYEVIVEEEIASL